MRNNNNAILIGAGHVGKRHAKVLTEIFKNLTIIDPNKEALNWCSQNLNCNVNTFENLENYFKTFKRIKPDSTALISNWGVDHAKTFFKLANNGIKNVYMEKPFASSLKEIDDIIENAKKNKINIVSGFQLRHSGVVKSLKEISKEVLGSLPNLISIDGGANCVVTNGIHFLDLAISIFESEPLSTNSSLNMDNINPRGTHLGFWEGHANWQFKDNRFLSINFSNSSSVSINCKVFCKNGFLTFSDKGPHIEIMVYKRNKNEITSDPRITRTGDVFFDKVSSKNFTLSNVVKDTLINLIQSNEYYDIERESLACKFLLSTLIANKDKKSLELPLSNKSTFYKKVWPVS